MKKIILTALVLCGLNAAALETGDLAQAGISVNHLMADGTEKTQDLLSKEKIQKFTVLEFFSTTCPACMENRPNFVKLANELSGKATFKLVGIDRREKQLRDFYLTIKSELTFPYVLDNNRTAMKSFNVSVTPTSFIVNEAGQIVYKHEGTFGASDMQSIRQILK